MTALAVASFATMTCLAFALEAYLKVLAQLKNNQPPLEGHNLRDLFHDLPTATQKELRKAWLRGNGGPAKMKKDARAADLPPGLKMPQSFEEALDLSAQAFIEWRYNHTTPSNFHVSGLLPLTRNEILKTQLDWRPIAGRPLTVLNPHPDFIKPKDEHVTIRPLPPGFNVLNRKPPALNIQIRKRSDPNNGGSGQGQ